MKTFKISTDIAAKPPRVWQILTEYLPADPTPFGIRRIEGQIAAGKHLKLWSETAPDRAFALKVATFEPPTRMIWRGGMPLGLFTGTRTFTLAETAHGTTFHMAEVFSGLFSGPITRSMPDLTDSFEQPPGRALLRELAAMERAGIPARLLSRPRRNALAIAPRRGHRDRVWFPPVAETARPVGRAQIFARAGMG